MRRAALLAALLAALVAPAGAGAAAASLPDVEDEVMCVTCNVPLNIAESPQADRQRAFIRAQIERGADKEQVKAALVAEYGSNVLGLPDEEGFGITAYAVPVVLGVLLVGILLALVPRWRRRSRGASPGLAAAADGPLSAADSRRLDEDLARYDA